jgi:hypothetical protein
LGTELITALAPEEDITDLVLASAQERGLVLGVLKIPVGTMAKALMGGRIIKIRINRHSKHSKHRKKLKHLRA